MRADLHLIPLAQRLRESVLLSPLRERALQPQLLQTVSTFSTRNLLALS